MWSTYHTNEWVPCYLVVHRALAYFLGLAHTVEKLMEPEWDGWTLRCYYDDSMERSWGSIWTKVVWHCYVFILLCHLVFAFFNCPK
jgi:hypothetical protein